MAFQLCPYLAVDVGVPARSLPRDINTNRAPVRLNLASVASNAAAVVKLAAPHSSLDAHRIGRPEAEHKTIGITNII